MTDPEALKAAAERIEAIAAPPIDGVDPVLVDTLVRTLSFCALVNANVLNLPTPAIVAALMTSATRAVALGVDNGLAAELAEFDRTVAHLRAKLQGQ